MRKIMILFTCIAFSGIQLYSQFTTPPANLENHVFILASDSLLGRGFGTDQGRSAADYIAQQFREAGVLPLNGSYLHLFNHRDGILNIPGINVAGMIPGNDPTLKEEFIVLGAHYDHLGWYAKQGDTVVYNGADDNASGTATLIEIGRNLAGSPASLGRTIVLVAFDGEESGLIGSSYFVQNSVIPPHKIKLMFSLDMVGMYKANGGLDLIGVKMLNNYEPIVGELAGEYGIIVKKVNKTVEQRTDTAPFGNIGIPAIHAFTGLKSPYHKPEDVASGLDYEGMAQVSNYMSAVSYQLSSAQTISDLPALEEGADQVAKRDFFRPGVRLNVGSSHHNYRDEAYIGKSILALEAGLFASLQATRFLMIQPELLYETKGSQQEDGNFRAQSITTPLNFLITTPDKGYVRTYLQLGGYYSYNFGGKKGKVPIDFEDQYKNHELGITYGLGMEAMNVQMGLYFQQGLTSIVQDSDNSYTTHQNIYFMFGFLF